MQAVRDIFRRTPPPAVVGALVFLSAGLGLLRLGEKSLWWDESYSVYFAGLNLIDAVRHEGGNAWLYHLLLRFWLRFGDGEAVVRGLSVLWAVATVPVAYALGARLLGRAAASVGVFLLVINAFFIRYAQEARPYSLLLFLSALSLWLFVRSVTQPSWKTWSAYVAVSVLAAYGHGFAVLNLPAQWVSLIFLRRRQIPWRSLAVSTGVIALLLLPLAAAVLSAGVGRSWIPRPKYTDVIWVFGSFAGQGGKVLLAVYFVACLGAVSAALTAWRSSAASMDTWRFGVLLAWLFVPVGIAFAVSQRTPMLVDKYLIASTLPLTLLAGGGIVRLRPRWAAAALLAALVAFAVHATVLYYTAFQKEDWRGVTRHITSHWEAGDGVLFFVDGGSRVSFAYYQSRLGTHIEGQAMPAGPSWDLSPYGRIWLVLSHDQLGDGPRMEEALRASLARRFANLEEYRFTDIRLILYSEVVGDPDSARIPASVR